MTLVAVSTVSPTGVFSIASESIDAFVEDTAGGQIGIYLREQEQVLHYGGSMAALVALFAEPGPTFVTLTAVGGLAARVVPAAIDAVENVAALVTRLTFSSGRTLDIAQAYAAVITALGLGRSYGDLVSVGGWSEALAADQSANQIARLTAVVSYVAPKRCALAAVSAMLTAAITGAGTSAVLQVFINGVVVPASATTLSFTQAGAETYLYKRFDLGGTPIEIAAGDRVDFRYTSTTITNTPTVVADMMLAVDATDTVTP